MNEKVLPTPSIPKYAFWDTDVEKMDLQADKVNIVSRIFDRGKLDDVLKFLSFYGEKECARIVTNNAYLQKDAMYLAHTLLSIPLQDFKSYALHKNN
ncbi:MAG: hypothetical protein ABI834_07735 [Ginsengibacter sp.]